MESKILKITWSKPGGNASRNAKPTAKISLPSAWLTEMGINADDKEVKLTFDGTKIIISVDNKYNSKK